MLFVNMAKSMPEAVLHYYISKYIDSAATLNQINITEDGITYTADITCKSGEYLYDIEFDSYEVHSSEQSIKKDIKRDIAFAKKGYKIIRMRNYTKTKRMPSLPNVINIGMPLNFITNSGTFPEWQIRESNKAIEQLLTALGATHINVSIERDYNYILDSYFPVNNWKHISNKGKKNIEKIVFWNSNGAFRNKYPAILSMNADVYIIAECENPEYYSFPDELSNYIWTGNNKSRGLTVFARPDVILHREYWMTGPLRHFLPFSANGTKILGVWAGKPYIEEYFVYQALNLDRIDKETIIIGDFNSNANWDFKHGDRTHSAVVKQLEAKGLSSVYHYVCNENQGAESRKTYFQYRLADKGYHIDYAFCARNRIEEFEVGNYKEWKDLSDHVPISLTIKE